MPPARHSLDGKQGLAKENLIAIVFRTVVDIVIDREPCVSYSRYLHSGCTDARPYGTRKTTLGISCLPVCVEKELGRRPESCFAELPGNIGGNRIIEVSSAKRRETSEEAKAHSSFIKESDFHSRLSSRTSLDSAQARLTSRQS